MLVVTQDIRSAFNSVWHLSVQLFIKRWDKQVISGATTQKMEREYTQDFSWRLVL